MQPANQPSAPQCPKCSGLDLKQLSHKEHSAPVPRVERPPTTTVYECASCGCVFALAQ